jgi:hypothetical protein
MQLRRTRFIALTAMCAALYAVSIVAFSMIPTPWGIGHFRPTVVIPAFFAFIGGPWVAAIGAAIGTFLGDVAGLWPMRLSNPLLSLAAGVPANFIGFLLFGYLIKRYNTLQDFVWVTLVTLIVGNFIAGIGVAFSLGILIQAIGDLSLTGRLILAIGLMLYWVVTMLPFMYVIVPLLVRYLSPIMPMAIKMQSGNVPIVSMLAIFIGIILIVFSYLVGFPLKDFFVSYFNVGEAAIFSFIAGILSIVLGAISPRVYERKI